MKRIRKCRRRSSKVSRPFQAALLQLPRQRSPIKVYCIYNLSPPNSVHPNFPFLTVTVVLCAVGGAPIMKQRKWEVDSTQTIGFISSFIRKKLALQKSDSLVYSVVLTCGRIIPILMVFFVTVLLCQSVICAIIRSVSSEPF